MTKKEETFNNYIEDQKKKGAEFLTARDLLKMADNIDIDKYINIFISVVRKNGIVTTWSESLELEQKTNSNMSAIVIDIINKVKEKKNWIGGKIETITIRDYVGTILYGQHYPKTFNKLLKK